mgnify:CR=1 FL=1
MPHAASCPTPLAALGGTDTARVPPGELLALLQPQPLVAPLERRRTAHPSAISARTSLSSPQELCPQRLSGRNSRCVRGVAARAALSRHQPLRRLRAAGAVSVLLVHKPHDSILPCINRRWTGEICTCGWQARTNQLDRSTLSTPRQHNIISSPLAPLASQPCLPAVFQHLRRGARLAGKPSTMVAKRLLLALALALVLGEYERRDEACMHAFAALGGGGPCGAPTTPRRPLPTLPQPPLSLAGLALDAAHRQQLTGSKQPRITAPSRLRRARRAPAGERLRPARVEHSAGGFCGAVPPDAKQSMPWWAAVPAPCPAAAPRSLAPCDG